MSFESTFFWWGSDIAGLVLIVVMVEDIEEGNSSYARLIRGRVISITVTGTQRTPKHVIPMLTEAAASPSDHVSLCLFQPNRLWMACSFSSVHYALEAI